MSKDAQEQTEKYTIFYKMMQSENYGKFQENANFANHSHQIEYKMDGERLSNMRNGQSQVSISESVSYDDQF